MKALLWLAFATAILASIPALAETPRLEKTDLFTARTGGYETYRIPGIVVTAKGTLLAYCEARKSARGDWGTIDILLRRSTDGGKTWEPARKVGRAPEDARKNPVAVAQKLGRPDDLTMNNPVAIAARDGSVHFLYCVEYARCFWMRSEDDGRTFSEPVEITSAFEKFRGAYPWKVLATGPGHGIELAGGRLLVPVWLSTGAGGHAHRPSCVSVIYSDDQGRTWRAGEIVCRDGPDYKNPSETAAVQLSDGRVMLNLRSESTPNRRLVSTSADGATGWTKPEFVPELLEPVCMASIVRFDRRHLAFVNPDNLKVGDQEGQPGRNRDRKNLTVKLSTDDGRTWPVARVLEPGISAYSDLAADARGTIYCFYENGGVDGRMYDTAALTLARFNLDWVRGKD